MVTASVASFLWPLLIEPFACALPKKLKMSHQQSSTNSHRTNDWRAVESSLNRSWSSLFSSTALRHFYFSELPLLGSWAGFCDPAGDLAKERLILQRWGTWHRNNVLRFKILMKNKLPVRPVDVSSEHSNWKHIHIAPWQHNLPIPSTLKVNSFYLVGTSITPIQFIFLKINFKGNVNRLVQVFNWELLRLHQGGAPAGFNET